MRHLKPLLPFEAYGGVSWSRALAASLWIWPLAMLAVARFFFPRRGQPALVPINGQNVALGVAASAVLAWGIFYWAWRHRAKAWETLYLSTESELIAPPVALESHYLSCEHRAGFVEFLGVILVSSTGLRFVAQKTPKPPEVIPYQALVVMAPLKDVVISLEPKPWWMSSGFPKARQRVKIAWPNNSTFFGSRNPKSPFQN